MANNDGQIVLGLDIPKTVSQINADIKKLQNQLVEVKATGALDTSSTVKQINSQISALQSQLKTINIKANVNTSDAQKTGQKIGQTVTDSAQKTIDNKGINIDKLNADIKTLANNLNSFSSKNRGFDSFKTEINGAEVSLNSLIDKLSTVDNTADLSTIRSQASALKTAFVELAQISEIKLSIDNGYGASEYQNQINKTIDSLKQYGAEAQTIEKINRDLQSTFDSMKGLSGQQLSNQADILKQKLDAAKVSIDEAKLSYDKLMQPASKDKITSTLVKVQKLLRNNTRVTEEVKQEWQSYVNRLSSGSDIFEKEIKDINLRLKETESQMQGMGKLGLSWTGKLKQVWEKFGGLGFATGAMMKLVNQLRKIPQEVYEIDTAMTNLYKVTDETSNKYSKFLDSVSDSAHDLGRSISSLVEQTANWAKLGFSLDEAEQLAKISSIYANVGEVDNDTAVSDMVTAMKAFNIEAADSITIVDKLNKLGNEYATSAADLGDGLSRSASAMATSGTDINKTLAMLTGGTEITQNASEFGNFLKIGSMRIRGMKGSLEELGEEVDDTLDSISKVHTQILNLTGGKVNIFDDMGNFRDYYDIMEDISKVYNDLNDPDKADLTEILFGKQRGNQGTALIQAFQSGQIQKALEATLNAEGSAMAEQEKWLESLEAKTQQFEAAFQSLSNTVLDSDLLKWFVDFGTGIVQAIDSIINTLGSLNTLSIVGGGFLGAKNLG